MLLLHTLSEVCESCEKLVICLSKASLLAFPISKTKKHKTRKTVETHIPFIGVQ